MRPSATKNWKFASSQFHPVRHFGIVVAVLSGEALILLALLTLTPGADTFLVLRQGLVGGLRSALPAIVGINCGLLIHAAATGAGLAVLLRTAPTAFRVVQILGVAYLAFLGVRSLLAARTISEKVPAPAKLLHSFRDGFFSNLLNPKVALFYVGFLPQFIPSTQPFFASALLYGLSHAVMGELQLSTVALAAHALSARLTRPAFRRGTEVVAGLVLLGFALRLALAH